MRHPVLFALLLGGLFALSACGKLAQSDVTRAVDSATRAEADSIREIMLTVADPREAVTYFQRQAQGDPDDLDKQRDLAGALIKAGRTTEGKQAWQRIVDGAGSNSEDLVSLADAMIRTSEWAAAKVVLDTVPPTHETFARYRLEAMVADSGRQWSRADSFYETAVGLTTTPAGVMNNWGYSKLTRGDTEAAERLFIEAITYDEQLFTAKNNLVLARANRRVYGLPIIPMTQEERAQLMHTAALSAIKQGDVDIGRNLLQDSIDTHPRHFEPAVRALQALNA